ncbi:MAG: sulfatase, partial [Methylophaga sp.]|nr:sulfatase [Methylophaga sp.]
MLKTIFSISLTGLCLASSLALAKEIVHDAEYYILEKQNGERWSVEDKDLDTRLAEFRKKNGGKS